MDVKPGEQIIALSDEDPNGILRWAQVVYTGEVISNVHAREFISLADYLEILRKREEENNS